MAEKNYDKQVKEWWDNKFSNTIITLNSFFTTLKKEKVQMDSISIGASSKYQIFQVIEGDTLLVKSSRDGYCIIYPRHETFIKLIFPFEEDYAEGFLKEEN